MKVGIGIQQKNRRKLYQNVNLIFLILSDNGKVALGSVKVRVFGVVMLFPQFQTKIAY